MRVDLTAKKRTYICKVNSLNLPFAITLDEDNDLFYFWDMHWFAQPCPRLIKLNLLTLQTEIVLGNHKKKNEKRIVAMSMGMHSSRIFYAENGSEAIYDL